MSGIDIKTMLGAVPPDLRGFYDAYNKIEDLLGQFEFIEPVDGEESYCKLSVEDWLNLKTGIDYFRECQVLFDENLGQSFRFINRLESVARMLNKGQIHTGSAVREIENVADDARYNNAPTACITHLLYSLGCNRREVDNIHKLLFRDGDASIMDYVRMHVSLETSEPNDVTYMSSDKGIVLRGVSSPGGVNDMLFSLTFSDNDERFVTISRESDMSKCIKESCCNRFHITYRDGSKSICYLYRMEDMWDTFEDVFCPTQEEIAVWDMSHPEYPFVGIESIRKVALSAIKAALPHQMKEKYNELL